MFFMATTRYQFQALATKRNRGQACMEEPDQVERKNSMIGELPAEGATLC
jgi:hypothetical protein